MNIRKELKQLSDKLKSENHPNYHNEARKLINEKYGKDWRNKERIKNFKPGHEMSYF